MSAGCDCILPPRPSPARSIPQAPSAQGRGRRNSARLPGRRETESSSEGSGPSRGGRGGSAEGGGGADRVGRRCEGRAGGTSVRRWGQDGGGTLSRRWEEGSEFPAKLLPGGGGEAAGDGVQLR